VTKNRIDSGSEGAVARSQNDAVALTARIPGARSTGCMQPLLGAASPFRITRGSGQRPLSADGGSDTTA